MRKFNFEITLVFLMGLISTGSAFASPANACDKALKQIQIEIDAVDNRTYDRITRQNFVPDLILRFKSYQGIGCFQDQDCTQQVSVMASLADALNDRSLMDMAFDYFSANLKIRYVQYSASCLN